MCRMNPDANGRRSRSHKAEVKFGDVVILDHFGQIAYVVWKWNMNTLNITTSIVFAQTFSSLQWYNAVFMCF